MKRVVLSGPQAHLRAQRWDVVILGTALAGWIAAIRLAMAHLRVLIVTERAAARRPHWMRDPFFLAGAAPGGALDACLRALALPLIDRRRLAEDPIAYQVVLPEARVGVGLPPLLESELVSWGLAKPDEAEALVRDLAQASAAELSGLLETPVVRVGGLRSLIRSRPPGRPPRFARGLPAAIADPSPGIAPFFDAQVRALVERALPTGPPEALSRLLGTALDGGRFFETDASSLHEILERRFLTLHGEVRPLPERFELVEVEHQPGIALPGSSEIWLGRALVLNAPRTSLADWLRAHDAEVPGFLGKSTAWRRRHAVRLRADRDIIPEGMARRVIRILPAPAGAGEARVLSLARIPAAEGEVEHLVATSVLPEGEDPTGAETWMEQAVRELMPFSEDRLRRVPEGQLPGWDDPDLLEEPATGSGWPGQSELRLSARPPVYRLAREELGALGVEGEVLLGWQGGDALREQLA